MKINRFLAFIITLFIVAGCSEFEYENDIDTSKILADLFIANRDFQKVGVITTYPDFDKEIVVERSVGLSKEVTLKLSVDPELLAAYNQDEGTNYKLLPASYYSFPETITFPENTKKVNLSVNLKPKDLFLVNEKESSNYVLPLKISGVQNGEDLDANYSSVMLNMIYDKPTIAVVIPEPTTELFFVAGVDITQEVVLKSTSNFTTLDVSKLNYTVDNQDVVGFNNENGTSYVVLPESAYTIGTISFEDMLVSTNISVHAAMLDPSMDYVLPLRMKNTAGYVINQTKPLYIKVKLEEIKLSFDNANGLHKALTNTASASGSITARLNSALLEEMPIVFSPNSALVADYNTENGTNFIAISADKIEVNNGAIASGVRTGKVTYTVNTSDLPLDDGNRYLVAFELNKDNLLPGTVLEQEVVYVEIKKSIVGKYTFSDFEGFFWGGSDLIEKNPDPNGYYKYRVKTFGTTPGWWTGFNLTTDIYNGNPNHLVLEREPSFSDILKNKSYLDTVTGTLYFYTEYGDPIEIAKITLSDIKPIE